MMKPSSKSIAQLNLINSRIVVLSLLLAVCTANTLTAQKGDLPNTLLAKNSNCVVNMFTMLKPGVERSKLIVAAIPFKRSEKITASDYPSIDEGMFQVITAILRQKMADMNMHPSAFNNINLGEARTNPDIIEDMMNSLAEFDPVYTISISMINLEKAKKAFAKGKLTLEHIKPVAISIQPIGATDPNEIYVVRNRGLSIEDAFKAVAKDIAAKDPSYFLEEAEAVEYVADQKGMDIMKVVMEENKGTQGFPASEILEKNEILVMAQQLSKTFNPGPYQKHMEKFYPYKYKLISGADYESYMDKGYRYILFPKTEEYKVTKTSVDRTEIKTYIETRFYFVIKDMETKEVFYGPSKEYLDKHAQRYPPRGLQRMLKAMNQHYNWSK